MIGAEPNTDWLDGCLELDGKGFVVTGQAAPGSPYATSRPGIYAVGDVRAGLDQAGGVERRRGVRRRGCGARFPQLGRRLRFAAYSACARSYFNNKSGQVSVICLPDFNSPPA